MVHYLSIPCLPARLSPQGQRLARPVHLFLVSQGGRGHQESLGYLVGQNTGWAGSCCLLIGQTGGSVEPGGGAQARAVAMSSLGDFCEDRRAEMERGKKRRGKEEGERGTAESIARYAITSL